MEFLCITLLFFSLTSAAVLSKGDRLRLTQYGCSKSIQWSPARKPKVIGGQVPPIGAVPWQITLRNKNDEHHCGGALISERLVLSAAHCHMEGLRAVAGAHGPPGSSPNEQVVEVEKFITHPDFSKLGPYSHDIALLVLAEPGIVFDSIVKPVCIPQKDPSPGTWCEVSGWGAEDPSNMETLSDSIRAAAVRVIPLDICRRDDVYGGFHQPILDSMLCAGHLEGNIDACRGDSGGPLVCGNGGRWELAGVVSWGEGCAQKNRPGIYTSVASFSDWIKENMQKSLSI